jgi:trehalose synthase
MTENAVDEPEVEPTEDEPTEHEPTEITYSEQFYAARPRGLRPRARLRAQGSPAATERVGDPVGTNGAYVSWLVKESMLEDAKQIAAQFSGQGSMWQNPFARPDAVAAVTAAPVWVTAYPISMITPSGASFLATPPAHALWKAFASIGIRALHTGPVKRAGGLTGWDPTPSVDGHFDRISTQIDSAFGTEDEFRSMCEVATDHGGTILDDIVPGHTGKGPDFRLAEMNVGDYPGIYHMVQIPPEDWGLLPEVPAGRDSVNLDIAAEDGLERAGYIIGKLQRVIFHAPGIKETNWSATAEVVGADGTARRWVYLHYFKEGQPSINWLDPSFAGMRLVIGDALHSLGDLGSGGLRLDANGFLGVEKSVEGSPAWSEGHPLSEAANQLIGSMVRKVGGFTFQELNLTVDDIRITGEAGADLSYDFVNRPAYHHALATGNTEFLRLTLNISLESGVPPISLVHALQNHDELTYELVHFETRHRDSTFSYQGVEVTGAALAQHVRGELVTLLTGPSAPYNSVFTTNGIASTTATIIAAALGYQSLDAIDDSATPRIRRAHLLLAMFNAFQPGVFALSGWDLTGMLTVDRELVGHLLATGDTRWIHRGAYDLMGYQPGATHSASGMPRARSLYGSLPEQLEDEESFARQLQRILELRERSGIATATQVDVPPTSHPGLLVMVHDELVWSDGSHAGVDANTAVAQATVLNFSGEAVDSRISSTRLEPGWRAVDALTGELLGMVDDLRSLSVDLAAHQGRFVVFEGEDAPPATTG